MKSRTKRLLMGIVAIGSGAALAFSISTTNTSGQSGTEQRGTESSQPLSAPTGNSTGTQRPTAVQAVPARLILMGDVAELSPTSTSIQVTLQVGSSTIDAITHGNQYVAIVDGANADDMVSIRAAAGSIEYRALAGSVSLLLERSGGRPRISLSEHPGLRVSPTSSAIYFFVTKALGNRLPESDKEAEATFPTLKGVDIATASYAIKAIGEGSVSMPAEFSDIYQLLANRNSFRDFVELNGFYYPENHAEHMSNTAALPFRNDEIAGDRIMIADIPNSETPTLPASVKFLQRTQNGVEIHTTYSRLNPFFDEQLLSSGDYQLTPRGAIVRYQNAAMRFGPFNTFVTTLQKRTLVSETFRRIYLGRNFSLWAGITQENASYPSYPDRGNLPKEYTLWSVSTAEKMSTPLTTADILGKRALPRLCSRPSEVYAPHIELTSCEYSEHRFESGGIGEINKIGHKIDSSLLPVTPNLSQFIQWEISSSGLLRTITSDASTSYWRIGSSNTASQNLVFISRSAANQSEVLTLAGFTAFLNGNDAAGLASMSHLGTWKYASFEEIIEPYAYTRDTVGLEARFIRAADGSQLETHRRKYPDQEFVDQDFQSGWQIFDGALYDTRYRANIDPRIFDPFTTFFPSCESAYISGATGCAPYKVRYFYPMARIDNRIYGIEDVYLRTDSRFRFAGPFQYVRASRPNYYEYVAH